MRYEYYIGTDISDEDRLMHLNSGTHKYIDKHKSKSGKWVYVYADKTTHNKIKNYQTDSENWKKSGMNYLYKANESKKGYEHLIGVARKLANAEHMGYKWYADEGGNIEEINRSAINSYNLMAEAVQKITNTYASKSYTYINMSMGAQDAAEELIDKYYAGAVPSNYKPSNNFKRREKNVTGKGKSVYRRYR